MAAGAAVCAMRLGWGGGQTALVVRFLEKSIRSQLTGNTIAADITSVEHRPQSGMRRVYTQSKSHLQIAHSIELTEQTV